MRTARIALLCILLSLANRPVQAAWPPVFRGPELYGAGDWPAGAATRGGLPAGIASGDLNGDQLPDIVVSNNSNFDFSGPGNTISVLIHYSDFTSPVLFQPKSNYRAVTSPAGLSTADMNRDGNLDVIVSSNGADSLAVLLGNGTGALGAPTVYSVPRTSVAGLKVADVNADGWPDVVLARDNAAPDGISVMLGTGGGALGPPIGYASGLPIPAVISFLATGDVTGDGMVDVVAADGQGGSGVVVFQGNNTGAFTAMGVFPDVPSSSLVDVEIARLNADAIPDLVVSWFNGTMKGMAVLIGTGAGAFMPYAHYPTTHDVGEISLADVDKDGRVDVVASGTGGADNTVTLFHGNGDGTFGAPTYYVATQVLYRSTLADVNVDGWPDLVAPVYTLAYAPLAHTVAVLLGDGAGGFLDGTENLQGRKPFREAMADFNRDGKLDVIASDSMGVTVGLGNGDGTFVALPKMNLTFNPGTIVVADWNRDGKSDFAIQRQGTTQVFGYIGMGDGTFVASPYFSLFTSVIFPRSVTDMNHDGRPDLVVGNGPSSLGVLTQDPGGTTFTMTGPTSSMSGTIQSLATGDWNRDGNPDVAVATNIGIDMSLGTGGGAISAVPNNLFAGRSYRDVCAGDFNRDGLPDLAGIEAAAGQTGVHGINMMLGNGAGFFPGGNSFLILEQNGYRIESWDANADGAPDIITSQLNDSNEFLPQTVLANMEVLLNNGNGTFGYALAHSLGLSSLSSVTSPYFASGDVTGDGLPDLVSPSLLSPPTSAYGLKTLRSIAPVRGAGLDPRVDYSAPQANRVAIGDLNRDGIPDVVSGSPTTPGVTVRLGNELGGLGDGTAVSQSLGVRQVGLADFNGDGIPDLVTSRTGLGAPEVVSCMLGIGDGTFGPRLDNPTVDVLDFAIADMNRDGRPDLVVGQPNAGGSFIRVLLGNGDGTFTPQAASSVSWVYDLDTADVTRDGIPDVVVAGGVLSVLYGNGDGTLSASSEVSVGTTTLQAICVADFDRDGYSDIAVTDLGGHVIVGWGSAAPPFSSYVTSSLPFSAWDIQVGAAKVDGQPYLYLSTLSNEVAILKQGAPGAFTVWGTFPTGVNPEALELADLNRDGALDVVTATSSSGNISVFLHGAKIVTGIESERVAALPIRLWQNYPNPFNPNTTIRFSLRRADRVRLTVFDVQGRTVATLVDEVRRAGDHSVIWRGRTDDGTPVASGLYFYRLSTAGGSEESRRMILLK